MPTLKPSDGDVRVKLAAFGDSLTISAPSGTVRVFHHIDQVPDSTVTNSSTPTVFGPYTRTTTLTLRCSAGSVDYSVSSKSVAPARIIVSSVAPSDTDGMPDGTVYIQTS